MPASLLAPARALATNGRSIVTSENPDCCCGACSYYLRGTICNPVICVPGGTAAPVYFPGCTQCPGGGSIEGKVVSTPSGVCYAIGPTHFCPPNGTGEPGCTPLPVGAQVADPGVIVGCHPDCSGCGPLTGYYLTIPCPCSDGAPFPIYVPCEVYQWAVRHGVACPVARWQDPQGLIHCGEVNPYALSTILPPGAPVSSDIVDGCCECCCGGGGVPFTPSYTTYANGVPHPTYGNPTHCCCNPATATKRISGVHRLYCQCPGGVTVLVTENTVNVTIPPGGGPYIHHTRSYNCQGQLTGQFDTNHGTISSCGLNDDPFGFFEPYSGYTTIGCYSYVENVQSIDSTPGGGCYNTKQFSVTIENADTHCNGGCGTIRPQPPGIRTATPGEVASFGKGTGCSGCGKDGKGGLTI